MKTENIKALHVLKGSVEERVSSLTNVADQSGAGRRCDSAAFHSGSIFHRI